MNASGQEGRFWLALVSVYIVWGSTYLAIHITLRALPPFLLAAARFLVAGLVLFAWMRMRAPTRERLGFLQWRAALIVGGALLCAGNGGVVFALRTVPTGSAALLVATTPLWTLLLGSLLYRETVHTREWLSLLLGLLGVTLLLRPWESNQSVPLAGALLCLFAAASWSWGSLYSRRAPLPKTLLLATSMEMMMGGLLLCVVSVVMGEWNDLSAIPWRTDSFWAFVYLVVFGSFLGFSAYVWLLKEARLAVAASYAYVNPAVAMFLGWIALDEQLTLPMLVGASVILLAVFVTVSRPRDRTSAADPNAQLGETGSN